jgi:hypothetical protein
VVALPNPASTSSGWVALIVDGGGETQTVAVADLDLDGHEDLLVAGVLRSSGGSGYALDGGTLDLWTGFSIDGGQLGARSQQSMTTHVAPAFVAVADFNGDGIPDIVIAGPPTISTALGGGAPGAPAVSVFLGSCP